MEDTINQTFGKGCYCRNCEFAKRRENGGFGGLECKRGILTIYQMNHDSFCSEGIPRQTSEQNSDN